MELAFNRFLFFCFLVGDQVVGKTGLIGSYLPVYRYSFYEDFPSTLHLLSFFFSYGPWFEIAAFVLLLLLLFARGDSVGRDFLVYIGYIVECCGIVLGLEFMWVDRVSTTQCHVTYARNCLLVGVRM